MSEIRVNNIVSADGANAPSFPNVFSLATGMGITNSPNITGSAVTFSGISKVTNSTDSTSSTTGALVVTGGVGIAKDVYIGAGLSVAGTLTYEDVTSVVSVGLITAKSGIDITGGGFEQTGGGEFKVGTALTIASTSGVATFSKDAVFNMENGSLIMADHDQNYLFFGDSVKATFGNSGDLDIYHSGAHSFIQDTSGSGNLYIDTNNLQIRNAAGSETLAEFVENSGISLKYDNSTKFDTTYEGVNVSGMMSASAGLAVTGGMWEGAFIKTAK